MVIMGHIFRNRLKRNILRVQKDPMNDLRSLCRMLLHLLIFFLREATGLAKDGIIHCNLPQIVHRGSLDHIPAEFLRQRHPPLFLNLLHQDPDTLTGSFDVNTGGIVPALHHHGKGHNKIIMHPYDVLRLLLYLRLQLFVVVI